MRLTPEQALAVEAPPGRLVLAAAAGSGKTRVITRRCLRAILDEGIPPHQVCAVTFTRAAASEMKVRIAAELAAAGRPDLAQEAETGPIQTIDSFCQRILRENALPAGIDPEFKIPSASVALEMKRLALRRSLAKVIAEDPSARLSLIAWAHREGERGLMEAGESAMKAVRRSESREALKPAAAGAAGFAAEAARQIAAAAGWTDAGIEPSLPLDLSGLIARMKLQGRASKALRAASPPALEAEAAEAGRALAAWALQAAAELDLEMDRRALHDHESIQARALRLLETRPGVRRRLARTFRLILVDEAQDVSPAQHRIIGCLPAETTVLVGDPQQSIYRFRGADPGVFAEEAASGRRLSLSINFRSEPGIIAFINRTFSGVWAQSYSAMRPAQELEADPDDPFGEPMPPASEGVEVWTPPQGWSAQKAGAAAAASILAEQESADPGSMAILCRTNANVQRTAAELARLGIPAQVIGGSQFYVRMETRDLANALEAVSNPGRRLSWLAMLRSPVVGLSLDSVVRLDAFPNLLDALLEQELPDPLDESRRKAALRWLPRLVERAGRISAWEALGEAAFESGLLERLAVQPGGRRRLANVRKLVQMAAESPDQGPKDFAEGLRAVQQIRSDEPDADSRIGGSRAVQVMTIHRSKGLEFDSVVLPDWSEVWGPRFGSPDSLPGMTLALPRSADGGAQAWRIHAWAQELEAEAAREELQRLAYVGMTRARRRLSLGLPTPGGRALVLAAQIGQWAASGEAGAPAVRSLADPEGSLSS